MALTVLGLGPGAPELLTLEARQALSEAQEVWLRTSRHPAVASLPPHLSVRSFDSLYEEQATFEAVYAAMVDRVWQLALRPEGVLYAVPGHPLIAEASVVRLLERCREGKMPVRVISGLSFVEPVLVALGIDPFTVDDGGIQQGAEASKGIPADPFPGLPGPAAGLQLVDALRPRVDPARPALVGQVYSPSVAAQLKLELLEYYPAHHPVRLVAHAGTPEQRVVDLPLYELDRQREADHLTCLYLPAVALTENTATFEGLAGIVARLRAPGGCPWDREQTHASLKPYLIEEAYEALDALEREDLDGLRQELGDLLLNIVLHCQLAAEEGEFEVRDMVRGISQKLLRRHPHVFGETAAETAQQVAANWEALKERERGEDVSMLAGIAGALPALAYTRSVQERLAPLGLGGETGLEPGPTDESDRLGEQLFTLAFRAAAAGLDPEAALRRANRAFTRRVERAERTARAAGTSLPQLPEERRVALWREAGSGQDTG